MELPLYLCFRGGYDPIALFAHEDIGTIHLEFDTPRAGGFEPSYVTAPGQGRAGLGDHQGPIQNEDVIVERIREAAKDAPLENLYLLSPQCGLRSCEIGNKLTEDEQWAKIALVNASPSALPGSSAARSQGRRGRSGMHRVQWFGSYRSGR